MYYLKKERDGCVFLLFQRGQKGSMVVDLYACNTGNKGMGGDYKNYFKFYKWIGMDWVRILMYNPIWGP